MVVENNLHLLPDKYSKEDLKQENVLAKLEGRGKVSRKRNLEKELAYGLVAPDIAQPLWTPEIPDLDAIEVLSTWLLQQAEVIKQAVLNYLEDPNEGYFFKVLVLLDLKFIPLMKEKSLVSVILEALPADKDTLYDLAIRVHHSKRPTAAVRVTLRYLARRDEITKDEEGIYRATKKGLKRRHIQQSGQTYTKWGDRTRVKHLH